MTDDNPWLKQASQWARDLTQISIALAAMCYVSGFIITSVYLASYGVVQVELVRARYVLVGFVFLLFCFGIIVPTALVGRLWEDVQKDLVPLRPASIGSLLGFLLVVALACFTNPLIFIGLALLSLSGPPWLPGTVPTIGFHEPLLCVGWRIMGQSARQLAIAGSGLILGFIVMVIVRSIRAAAREARGTPLAIIPASIRGVWTQLNRVLLSREGLVKVIKAMVGLWIVFMLGLASLEFIDIVLSDVPVTYGSLPGYAGYASGLIRRVILVSLAWIFISACFSTQFMRTHVEEESKPSPGAESGKKATSGYLFLGSFLPPVILFVAALFITVYTLAIFPALGYHVGGGAPQPVTVFSENEEIQAIVGEGDVETYLLDRSGHEYLFVFTSATGDYQVMEISTENIDSIVYKREAVESEVE